MYFYGTLMFKLCFTVLTLYSWYKSPQKVANLFMY